ncbi:MAG: fibronectin type III domain-containing protein [Syntrophotaleaceae bacterium]
MNKYHKLTIAVLLILATLLLVAPSALLAQNISLDWDPSDSEDVAGYKIYYKANSTELPLDGIEALEGPSPIDVGNVTSFTLTEMPEGSVYYFRATAYDSAGNESTLSNLAASAWIPAPISPQRGETAGAPATLVWTAPPQDRDLTFTVIYGTDPQLRTSSATIAAAPKNTGRPSMPGNAQLLAALLCLAGLAMRQLASRFGKRRLLAATVCLGLALSTASCGGGGGGGGSDSGSSPPACRSKTTP